MTQNVGTLEIQVMAGIARIQKDMGNIERVVGGSMNTIEKSVANAQDAISKLGMAISGGMVVNTVRSMTDAFIKMDAQIRLSTKTQQEYNTAVSDIRQISATSQTSISATTLLYTRMMNVMKGSGVEQSKLANVTATVGYSLKAFGATAQEAAGASLQLSQALGSNRLGGDEFRAVMEAAPPLMRVLADSMGVTVGHLRELSIAGRITAAEMIKAWGDPAIAAAFEKQALAAQTVGGAITALENEIMLLVGNFNKASGISGGLMSSIQALASVIQYLSTVVGHLVLAFAAYVTLMAGKYLSSIIEARFNQILLNMAHEEALVMNVAIAAGHAACAQALRDEAMYQAFATGSTKAATAANKTYEASILELSAAQTLHAVKTETLGARVLSSIGKGGFIGIALFGIYEAVSYLEQMDKVTDKLATISDKAKTLTIEELAHARQLELVRVIALRRSVFSMFNEREIRAGEDMIRIYQAQIDKLETQTQIQTTSAVVESELTHDRLVMQKEILALSDRFNEGGIRIAAYLEQVNIILRGGKAAVKALSDAEKKRLEGLAEGLKYQNDYWASVDKETESLIKKATQLEFENSLIGKSKEAIAELTNAREDATLATLEQVYSEMRVHGATETEIEAINRQIDAMYRLKNARDAKPALEAVVANLEAQTKATKAALDEQAKAHEEFWASIDRTAHDTFVTVLQGGQNMATKLRDTFKSILFDWLYQMTLKKWIINISTMTGGVASTATLAGTGGGLNGGGGVSSWMSVGKSIWDGMSGGFTEMAGSISGGLQAMGVKASTAGSIGVAGAYVGAGMAGIGLGSMIAGNKTVVGLDGTTTATIGAIIGSIAGGPIGGLIGGAVGGIINAAFGSGPKTSGTTTLAGKFTGAGFGGQYNTPWSQSGGWFSGDSSGVDVAGVGATQVTGYTALMHGSQSVFDALTKAAGGATRSLNGWLFSFNRQIATEAQATQLIVDMSNSMGAYLIPELAAFQKSGESMADTAVRMKDTFIVTDSIMRMVGQTFNKVGIASMGMRANLVDLLGGVASAGTQMQTYYQAFYSQNEQAVNGWGQMAGTLRALGVDVLPTTNAQYRALIEAQDLNTVAGQELFAQLIGLAPTFNNLTTSTTALNAALTTLSTDSFVTLVDYTRALRLSQQGGAGGVDIASVLAGAPAAATPTPSSSFITGSAATAAYSASNPNPTLVAARDAAILAAQTPAPSTGMFGSLGQRIALAKATAMPTYSEGTNYVPQDGFAFLHKGESVTPTSQNQGAPYRASDSGETAQEIRMLRSENMTLGSAVKRATEEMARILKRFDGDGMPPVRVIV